MERHDPPRDRDAPTGDLHEVAAPPEPATGGAAVTVLEAVLIIPLASWLCWRAIGVDWTMIGWGALFFVLCIAAVDLIPIPAWEDIELSLSFPIMIGVAMLYSPPVAGMIVIIGSSDIHELRRETPFLRAMWNRSQMALAIIAASMVFHELADVSDRWWILVPAALAATIAAYAINAILVALHASLQHGLTVRQVLRKMHGTRPVEFLASYIGLALFGVVIARFFVEEGAWSVVVFLAPLGVRATDVLPEPDDGRPSREPERAPHRAGRPAGTTAPEGERDGRSAPRAQPDEGRVRRGGLARAPHADHGDDRLREDAATAAVRERRRPARGVPGADGAPGQPPGRPGGEPVDDVAAGERPALHLDRTGPVRRPLPRDRRGSGHRRRSRGDQRPGRHPGDAHRPPAAVARDHEPVGQRAEVLTRGHDLRARRASRGRAS